MKELDQRIETLEDLSFDFGEIFSDLKKYKYYYFILLPVSLIVVIIYSCSLPNIYQCKVIMSPEILGKRGIDNSVVSLASAFGVRVSNVNFGDDALYPTLYPDIIESVDFKTTLSSIIIKRVCDGKTFTYFDYLAYEQESPWWSTLIDKVVGSKKILNNDSINQFRLTVKQEGVFRKINGRVNCSINKKNMEITIMVKDQDPVIAAQLADSVCVRLQSFITNYRTQKARIDLSYCETIYKSAKVRYENAQCEYAKFSDSNKDAISQNVLSKMEQLEGEMNLQKEFYQEAANNYHLAESKLQEVKPAFTILQRATVPLNEDSPNRIQLTLIFVFVVFLGISFWALVKENDFLLLLGFSEKIK